ncbi:FG-GAP repeat domain-containing protein [Nocardia sp. NPDC056611]|uniref:FG-GAP repeat domain-containing protein n=1 Tax=Nocardia sp. NPDC056611 TaxID=3345877 RepID=UPI0036723E0A
MVNRTPEYSPVGTFDIHPFDTGALGTEGVIAVDLDGDGRKDIASANFWSLPDKSVSALRNTGGSNGHDLELGAPQHLSPGTVGLQSPMDLPAGLATQAVVADDFNRDGVLDLAAPSGFEAALNVYINRTPQQTTPA